MVKSAPKLPVTLESSKEYVEAAKIALQLAYYIRSLGYDARAHIDGNYLVIAPLVAASAGLGEIGRMGILMTEKYGPRVRLGVVTTDMPLVEDQPVDLGMQDFCRICRKCSQNCPSGAISEGEKTEDRGVLKWKVNQEKCYWFWRKVGTDCAICMNTCPYSKPDTPVHRLMRFSIRNSHFARKVALIMDDYLYGKRPYSTKQPSWM
jgi:reductive dehalogenase